MPVIAILIDLITCASYFFQLNSTPSQSLYLLGMILQAFFALILLIIAFTYSGKKFARIQPHLFYRVVSIRYWIILISKLINGAVQFLYVLNYLGINYVVFSNI